MDFGKAFWSLHGDCRPGRSGIKAKRPGVARQPGRVFTDSAARRRHAQAILDIFNEAILTSTALYDYRPRTLENMVTWFAAKDYFEVNPSLRPSIWQLSEAGRALLGGE